jgi:hypothetical protein
MELLMQESYHHWYTFVPMVIVLVATLALLWWEHRRDKDD